MQSTVRPSRILPVLLFLAAVLSAQAPVTQGQEQSVIIEHRLVRYLFNNDGTAMHTVEMRWKVISAAGVQALGQLAFGYSSDSEQLTIDYIRVHKPDGRVVETSLENSPEVSLQIARDAPVYTDYREKHISVAALSPGDTLEYKITQRLLHPLAKDQFWLSHSFRKIEQTDDEQLIVEVPKERELRIKSGLHYTTEETAVTRILTWKTSNQPKDTSAEKKDSRKEEPAPAGPDVQLSTFRSWHEVAGWYDGLLRARTVPDPETKARAEELLRGATDNQEKARRLYKFVSQDIRYVSLSFGIGRFQPHFPAEVLHNGYGDCKDKHTLLAALLQSAGIGSRAVLIHSATDLDAEVPSPSQFDHLLTAADIDGRRVWLDSTPGITPYALILPNLRDRQALLIAPELEDPLVRTPEITPIGSSESMEVTGQVDEGGNLEADISFSMEGDRALVLRFGARQTPRTEWNNLVRTISYRMGFAGDVSAAKIENLEAPELPLRLFYHYSRKQYFAPDGRDRASGRNELPLTKIARNGDDVPAMKKNGKIRLGGPDRLDQKIRLRFAPRMHPVTPISVSVKRDYGDYVSTYELKGDELIGERIFRISVPSLPLARERDAQAFLTAINQDTSQQIAVGISPGAVDADIANSTDAEKLDEAARARLEVDDFRGAEEFGRRAVKADPQSATAWNNLGLSYMGEGKSSEAESAFRKQIEINPYDEYAWSNLGILLGKLKRNDESLAAFRRQIEIVPLDRKARKNLALALFAIKGGGDKETLSALEKASQIDPDDVSLKMTLALVYSSQGAPDKADRLLAALNANSPGSLPVTDLFKRSFDEGASPGSALQAARRSLQQVEQDFEMNRPGDRGHGTASAVSAQWASIGWALFRDNRLEDAERYLHAAWVMSQASSVALRLAKVYEKEGRTALAARTLAEGAGGEGDKEGLRDNLVRLVGNESKAGAMITAARPALSTQRSLTLNHRSALHGSATVLLTFSHGNSPEKVEFSEGSVPLVDHYEAAIKSAKFPIVYPDETPQHIVRQAILFCGSLGCSIVVVAPSAYKPTTLNGPLTTGK